MNTTRTELTFFNEDDLAAAMPNLDGFDPSELDRFVIEARSVIVALGHLKSYGEAIAMAKELRLKGNIELALNMEGAAQTHYEKLPTWAKW